MKCSGSSRLPKPRCVLTRFPYAAKLLWVLESTLCFVYAVGKTDFAPSNCPASSMVVSQGNLAACICVGAA